MKRRSFYFVSILGFFVLLVSCSNVFLQRDSSISFSLDGNIAGKIREAVSLTSKTADDKLDDDTDIKLTFKFDGLSINDKEETTKLDELESAVFVFDHIPFNKEFKILVDISFNDIIIYQGVSNSVTLTEASDGCNVNISINLKPGKIVYESNGGSIKGSSLGNNYIKEYYITSNITAENLPYGEKTGYSFGGWYFDKQCTKPVESLGKDYFVGDVKLYAKWDINHFTISYETGTEEKINPKTVEYGYKIVAGDIPARDKNESDYLGWYFGDKKIEPGYVVDSDITLTCRWQEWGTVKPVTFNPPEGDIQYLGKVSLASGTSGASIYYTTNGDTPTVSSTPYTGEISINNDQTTIKAIAVYEGMKTSDVAEAAYTATYTVSFDRQGHGTAPEQKSGLKRGDLVPKPADLSEPGYTFGGWYKEKSCENIWDFDTEFVTGGKILFAKWSPITYKVQFDRNGGEFYPDMEQQILTFDKVETLYKNTFTKPGFEFAGWNTEQTPADNKKTIQDETSRAFNFKTKQDEVQILYAQWNDVAPGPVENLKAVLNSARDSVHLSWDNPSDYDLAKIVITCEGTTINYETTHSYDREADISIADYSSKNIFTFKATTVDNGGNSCDPANVPSASCDKNEYTVGDIIMTDGTYISKEQITDYSGSAKPVAIIFSVKSGNTPAKGVGLFVKNCAWSSTSSASINITSIFDQRNDDKDGSDNWAAVQAADSSGASNAAVNYPAFDFANNYGTTYYGSTSYSAGWYLPSMGELTELGKIKVKDQHTGLLDVILLALKDKFTESGKTYISLETRANNLWSSNQGREAANARSYYLGHTYEENKPKNSNGQTGYDADNMNACAVRQFVK